MKEFTMSMYANKEDLYKAKAEYYESLYNENRVAILQYNNLRKHFSKMIDDVLGEDYYNMDMDVYGSDQACCEDITRKAKGFFQTFFN